MLPILRIISVGGVSLAIVIFLLALSPPEDSRLRLAQLPAPARGPLIDQTHHPEWRQFLMQAALRRANELQRLRDLPDSPVKTAPLPAETAFPEAVPEPAIIEGGGTASEPAATEPTAGPRAGLPAESSSDPDDITGSTGGTADDTSIPIDIGAASSAELPVLPAEETPPVVKTPRRGKPRESRSRTPRIQRARQAKPRTRPAANSPARPAIKPSLTPAATPEAAPQFNLPQALRELFAPNPDRADAAKGARRTN